MVTVMALLQSSDKVIRTARLVLRPLRAGDDARIFALFANWNVVRFLSSPPWPYAAEDARAFVQSRLDGDTDDIGGVITREGALVGMADVIGKPASVAQRERAYSLGYWLGEPCWSQGYMTEAARALLTHVFASIPDDTIYSGAFSENAASLRIQDKLGFTRDGEATFFANPHGKDMPHV